MPRRPFELDQDSCSTTACQLQLVEADVRLTCANVTALGASRLRGMGFLDATKELADMLTSAFGKGWGWALVFAVTHSFKKAVGVVLFTSYVDSLPTVS